MTRDIGWRFLSLGRRIERLQALCAALREALVEGRDGGLEWLLELADSSVTYRSRYIGQPEWLPVFDLLIRDESNPRSVAFQLHGFQDVMGRLQSALGSLSNLRMPPVLRRLGIFEEAQFLRSEQRVLDWLAAVSDASATVSDELSLRLFSHAEESTMTTFAS
jgi:uncharacterized alpha-E superfamily protein